MKKALSLILALVLALILVPAAGAANDEADRAAEALHALGLFQGKGVNPDGTPIYDLESSPTRMEAVTMLVRLLGKETEAKAGTWDIPFTDVDEWAKPYVGYAYANGLTKGTGDTTFGGRSLVTATQYLTFILRALGYESGRDFSWDAAWKLSDRLGITGGEYGADSGFLRGDVAVTSFCALTGNLKGTKVTLAEKLMGESVFSRQQFTDSLKIYSGYGTWDGPALLFLTEPARHIDIGSGRMCRFSAGIFLLTHIPENVRGYQAQIDDRTEGSALELPGGGYFSGPESWFSVVELPLLQHSVFRFQTGHEYHIVLDLLDAEGRSTGITAEADFLFTEGVLGPALGTPADVGWSEDGMPVWTGEESDLVDLHFEARSPAWGEARRYGYALESVGPNHGTSENWPAEKRDRFIEKIDPPAGTEIRFCVRLIDRNLMEHNYSSWSEWSEWFPIS